jgi:hypothetical protein
VAIHSFLILPLRNIDLGRHGDGRNWSIDIFMFYDNRRRSQKQAALTEFCLRAETGCTGRPRLHPHADSRDVDRARDYYLLGLGYL